MLRQARLQVNRFPGEDPHGPVDEWLQQSTIPPRSDDDDGGIRVALIALWVGPLPEVRFARRCPTCLLGDAAAPAHALSSQWMDFTTRSISFAAEQGLLG